MEKNDGRIDAYIAKSASFAQPILTHLRDLVHRASPDILETVKWSMPFFDCQGTVCNMASFKQHCTFGFWKSTLMPDPHDLLKENTVNAIGQLGRVTSLADLPPDEVLIEYIRDAVELNKLGIKVSGKPAQPRTELIVPDYFLNILKVYPAAEETFTKFSYSHKKEYVQWFNDAKTEVTRQKRIATAIEWLTEGKARHWKYDMK